MEICVIGAGYVGLVTAICLSEFGHHVRCIDIDEERIESLKKNEVPFYEPGLSELLDSNVHAGRFIFTTNLAQALKDASVVYIAVGTPMDPSDGSVNLRYVYQVAKDMAPDLDDGVIVVDKSTVPVGTARKVKNILTENGAPENTQVVSNPEFLREGSAVNDFMEPDRVVLGVDSPKAAEILKQAYQPMVDNNVDFLVTSPEAAELVKYASNAFLAIKLTFINEIALLANKIGIDVLDVARGVGMDNRIGKSFLKPGPGYGGSCLPKDTNGLLHIADSFGSRLKLVEMAIAVNDLIPQILVSRIEEHSSLVGKKIGLLGLAFKAGTDDVRDSPAIAIAKELLKRNADIVAYDPEGIPLAKRELGDSIEYVDSVEECISDKDIVVVATEWSQFANLDPRDLAEKMSGNLLVDFRNLFNPQKIKAAGLEYIGMGRN